MVRARSMQRLIPAIETTEGQPLELDVGVPEGGKNARQHGAEVARKILSRVGTEICNGLDGSRVGGIDGDLGGWVLVEVVLGMEGG